MLYIKNGIEYQYCDNTTINEIVIIQLDLQKT